MTYSYEKQRANIFTEDGQVMFLKIRDQVYKLIKIAGAVRVQEAIAEIGGDSWDMLACLDRLVELGEIEEVITTGSRQRRIFIKARK
jgi:hypothetical protein